MGEDNCDCGGGVCSDDVYKGRAEPMLVSLSDLYSEDDSISVRDSRLSRSLKMDLIFIYPFHFYFTFFFIFNLFFYF